LTHLTRILSAYDSNNYTEIYRLGDPEKQDSVW